MNDNIYNGLEVAVIGIAGRFPGADNINKFWENLKQSVESISFFNDEELISEGIPEYLIKKKNYVKAKGFLENAEYFDASFFGYNPKDAELLDPQVRIFHECVWEALENAAYIPDTYKGLIGLYAGKSVNPNWDVLTGIINSNKAIDQFETTMLNNTLSTLISYKLNLKGPSLSLYTACSTSLVAVHLACQGLLNGECDMAIAGGVTIFSGKSGYMYHEGMISSPDGHCKPFDADAKGTVFGNGIGLVVLKRLEEAIKDNDHIYAIIRGSAINNDGVRKVGYTAPSIDGQIEVIRSAQQIAEVDPESISYIETHGTGTILGDPIEFGALKTVFNKRNGEKCAIGSVKSNIGHLDTAAGIAGFIKATLSIYNKQIPPSINFKTPNPKLNIENSQFYVNTTLKDWIKTGNPLRAGVSSFGIGGTNAHVILEEAPERNPSSNGGKWKLITLSAKNADSLNSYSKNLAEFLKKNPDVNLSDAAYTLNLGRKDFEYRTKILSSNVSETINMLLSSDEIIRVNSEKKKIVFMFTGQGAQYVNMALGLYKTEKVFKEEIDRCFEIIRPYTKEDLRKVLFSEDVNQKDLINETQYTQPLLFILEYALAKFLMNLGIKPYAMLGHSIGEYVAACLSEVFSLEDALKLVAIRGAYMQSVSEGDMISVSLSEEKLLPLINNREKINIAAINAPELSVLSGDRESISQFSQELKEKGYRFSLLNTSHAFHSWMMDPILDKFEQQVSLVKLNTPKIPFLSNVSGTWISVEQATNPRYWSEHLRKTVRFSDAIKELLVKDNYLFIEVGPGRTLSTLTAQHITNTTNNKVVNLVRHPNEDIEDVYYFLNKLGEIWVNGIYIDWEKYYANESRQRIPLPTYAFEKKAYKALVESSKGGNISNLIKGVMTRTRKISINDWFYAPVWQQSIISKYNDKSCLENKTVLIFLDELNVGNQLISKLKNKAVNIITVKKSTEYAKLNNSEYNINPNNEEDYSNLFNDLADRGIPPVVVHLFSIYDEIRDIYSLDRCYKAQELGFYSLVNLSKAIGKQKVTDEISIYAVTNNIFQVVSDDNILPEKSTLIAAVKGINKEYYNIVCRGLELVISEDTLSTNVDYLLQELYVKCSNNPLVAYRHGVRWIPEYKPIQLKDTQNNNLCLKDDGVYIITGGLGGLGLEIATYISEHAKANIILVGRTPFPLKDDWNNILSSNDQDKILKINRLKTIESKGCNVDIECCDISDYSQLSTLFNTIFEKFKHINGIVHTAGVADYEGIMQLRTKSENEKIFGPKLYGTLNINSLLREKSYDFFVLFSSISSITVPLGEVGYAAANAFLDSFAHYKINESKVISINWGAWNEVGMAVKAMGNLKSNISLDEDISPEEGRIAFNKVLHESYSQVIVTPRDLRLQYEEWLKKEKLTQNESAEITVKSHDSKGVSFSSQLKLEQFLISFIQENSGLKNLNSHDNLFEVGFTSINMIQFNAQLKTLLGKDIPLIAMFEYSTINTLSDYIAKEYYNISEENTKEVENTIKQKDSLNKLKKLKTI